MLKSVFDKFKLFAGVLALTAAVLSACAPVPAVAQSRPDTLIMETGVNAVTAGANIPGWVSGDPASLAASAQVTMIFDLGANWRQYTNLFVVVSPTAPSTGFSGANCTGSDTAAINTSRRFTTISTASFGTLFSSSLLTSNGPQGAHTRPAGRYVVCQVTNADATNALGSNAKVTLVAYP